MSYLPADVKLTRRETEVCSLLIGGSTNKEIASAIRVKQRTVKFHVSNLLRKFKVKKRVLIVLRCH